MLATLRQRPRPLKGRCGACAFRAVCGGNTRIRALQVTGDPWAEDPACYLSNAEIGVEQTERLTVTPFRGKAMTLRIVSSSAVALAVALLAGVAQSEPDGAAIYADLCASCHAETRLGAQGPALIPESLGRLKGEKLAAVIADGRPMTQMPAFGPR
jgi:mono/diheme cytochrome c family protein